MDQGGLPACPFEPSWHLHRRLKVHHATRRKEEQPHCVGNSSVKPQRPWHLQFGMEGIERALGLSHLPCAGHY